MTQVKLDPNSKRFDDLFVGVTTQLTDPDEVQDVTNLILVTLTLAKVVGMSQASIIDLMNTGESMAKEMAKRATKLRKPL